jgi:DNA-binding phage protein
MRDVVEAQGGMTRAARLAGLNRESLYRQLSRRGNPSYFLPSDKSAATLKKVLLICSHLQQFSKIISPPNCPLAAVQ